MDGCIYRTRFNMCEKNKAEDEQKGIRRWCGFEDCTDRHPSNLDRLRTMSDEELADWIVTRRTICPTDTYACSEVVSINRCIRCWLDWLHREADS